jgi:hypothetical protein
LYTLVTMVNGETSKKKKEKISLHNSATLQCHINKFCLRASHCSATSECIEDLECKMRVSLDFPN